MNKKSTQPGGGTPSTGAVVKGFFAGIGRLFATMIMVGVITGCIVASVLTVYILNYIDATESIPLDTLELGYTSMILATDKEGKTVPLQNLYITDNNRIWVNYADISDHVKEAVVAVEDKRFWEHEGVDWKRTLGAGLYMFGMGSAKGGGSTITQQLIKNVTDDDEYRVDRKVREIFRALDLSRNYSRERVLEAYLNVVPFGAGANGIESAARTYFGKTAKELDLAEAAAIVGITQKPTAHNPFLHPDANKKRQEHVLWEMLEQDIITQKEYDDAVAEKLNFKREEHSQEVTEVQSYFVDHVINQVLKDLQEKKGWTAGHAFNQLYKGGYRIYSTVDVEMQDYLEEFYKDSSKFPSVSNAIYPQSCATITDPNGKILAVVGGIGEKTNNRVLNRATMSTRQPGSALKPLGPYAVAFELDKVNWSKIITDSPINIAPKNQPARMWPVNYYGTYKGPVTVSYAIQQSVNTVPVKLVEQVTPQAVFDFLHDKLNMYSLVDSIIVDGGKYTDVLLPPMALGALTFGVTPLEMAGGYQIYTNGGYFTTPYCYTKVEDANGRIILETDTTPIRVISEETSVIMNKALQLVTSQGTGTAARLPNMPTAGKTGTSEDDVNQWFMGITPYYVAQVWLGYDKENRVNDYGNTVPNSIGYYGRPYPPPVLWKSVMAPLHEGLEHKAFPESDGVVSKTYCTISGNLATSNCTSVATGWYKAASLPGNCAGHVAVDPDGDNGGGDNSTNSRAKSSSSSDDGVAVEAKVVTPVEKDD